MDQKKLLTNKSFCPLPWTGFIAQQNGEIKNCVLAEKVIGNINNDPIEQILKGEANKQIKEQMLADQKPSSCVGCYKLEHNKKTFDIISQRIYYIKELKSVNPTVYDKTNNFDLHTVDLRWTNQCNQACVYCGPNNSSMWEKEVGPFNLMKKEAKESLKKFIFSNIKKLKNVYLAGGEPTLMHENLEFLTLLLKKNPNINLRVNTNLSNTNTKVAKLIKQFKNVHWIISVESTGKYYDYIRYGGNWETFYKNLKEIKNIKGHKISFNMLYFILNYKEIFRCIDFLSAEGFHNNSFIVGILETPLYLNILNLPAEKIAEIKTELINRINTKPGYFLEDGYRNLLSYLDKPYRSDLKNSFKELEKLDTRRNLNSKIIFKELYDSNY